MKIDFNNPAVFTELEDKAIDGQLNYDDLPPCEYKYFSKLTKLGYKNRHDGWSVEICELKQEEYKQNYISEKDMITGCINVYRSHQDNIRRAGTLLSDIEKSTTAYDIALKACEAIGCMTGDVSFFKRQKNKMEEQNAKR